jgi:hypothetical protein
MRAVAAATDKRFRRAHVKPARKGGVSGAPRLGESSALSRSSRSSLRAHGR